MLRKTFLALFVALVAVAGANAATIIGVLPDPATTAGGGATSTRSGPGTFHIYGIDDNADSYGISSYSLALTGATAINHRSPTTLVQDANEENVAAGFNLLRSGTGANPVVASQPLPGANTTIPNGGLVKGMGQEASSFAAKFPGMTLSNTTSGAWGDYNDALDIALAPRNGKNWVLLAEGTYSGSLRTQADVNTFLPTANVTLYGNQGDYLSSPSTDTQIVLLAIPEPATLSLIGLAMVGLVGFARRRSA